MRVHSGLAEIVRLLLLLTLPSVALAHVPHDLVAAGAIPLDLDDALPWFVVQDVEEENDLYRSLDGGATWDTVSGACLIDDLTDGAYTEAGVAVLLGEDRYWYTTDGERWSSVALSFTPTGLAGGAYAFLGGPDGVYRVLPGAAPFPVLTGVDVTSVHEAVDGVVAVASDGTLHRGTGGSWTSAPTAEPGQIARAATADDDYLYAGYDSGAVWRWDGATWSVCGMDPYAAWSLSHPEVVKLATDGDTLLMARADIAAAVSEDGCASWDEGDSEQVIDWPEDEGASSASTATAFTVLQVHGDAWVVGGYDGLTVTRHGENDLATLKGADFTRGAAFSRSFGQDGGILLGGYGSGVARSLDGGATWEAPGMGVENPNIEDVLVAPDAIGMSPAISLHNRVPFVSDDDGASWTELTGPFAQARQIEAGPRDRFWVINLDTGEDYRGGLLWTDDRGATWNEVTTWPESLGTAGRIHGIIDRSPRLVAWSDDHVYRSMDDGLTWTEVFTSANLISDVVAWPRNRPIKIAVADADGIWVQEGPQMLLRHRDGDAEVVRMTVANNHTLAAVDQLQRVLLSTDAGRNWAPTGAVVPNRVYTLAAHPHFRTFPQLVVGGSAGAFLVEGATVSRLMDFQRYDDGTDWVECGACVRYASSSAAMGRLSYVEVGDPVSVPFRGTSLRVYGETGQRATGLLTIDDAAVTPFSVAFESAGSVLVEVTGLDPGWHEAELELVTGGPVSLDGFVAEGTSTPMSGVLGILPAMTWVDDPDAEWPEEEAALDPKACAAVSGPGGGVLALAGVGWALTRRRRSRRAG